MYKAVSSEAALFQSDPFITFIFSTGGIILKPYIIKRILSAIPLLLIISFVCFVFINLIPSDPAEVALRVRQVPIITEDAIAEVRSQLGLDKPYLVRYFTWVLDCLHGDFGISYVNPSRTVAGELLRWGWMPLVSCGCMSVALANHVVEFAYPLADVLTKVPFFGGNYPLALTFTVIFGAVAVVSVIAAFMKHEK